MARDSFASIETTASSAESLHAQGHLAEAAAQYRRLVRQTHVVDFEYDDWLRSLAEIYQQLGRRHHAGACLLYLHYFDSAKACFQRGGDETELGRVLETEKRWQEAASIYLRKGLPVHGAVALEKSGDTEAAADVWGRLVKDPRLRDRFYELALVHFNLGSALESIEKDSGRRAFVDSQRLLEQVADEFETKGERERAFDCYQILLKLGKDSGQFENLAEGYVNCIRVLKEDNLKFYVLQYYDEFANLAAERKELYAAATLYQDAANFSARNGLPYDRHYQEKSAETWVACAEGHIQRGASLELVEGAFLAAIAAYSAVGSYAEVRELFVRLGAIDLSEKKQARYQRLADNYREFDAVTVEAPEFPDYLRQHHYADIWFVDLLEWELGGEPRAVALSILGDLRYPNPIRRRALAVALAVQDSIVEHDADQAAMLCEVAELLGELQSYPALNPLERLFEHSDARVRRCAVRALRFLFFKRSFALIRKALADSDEGVVTAAVDALRSLHFPHAFNPLARIFHESADERVRGVALSSIGKIQSIEAGEFLLGVLRQETGVLRDVARDALLALDNPDVLPILKQNLEIETHADLRQVLESLQGAH